MKKDEWKQLLHYPQRDFVPIDELVKDTLANIGQKILSKKTGIEFGLSTGLHDLDYILQGIHPSDFILIGGRPSMGKTSLALTISQHMASFEGVSVVYFTVKSPANIIVKRLLSMEANINSFKLRHCNFNNQEIESLMSVAERIKKYKLIIDDTKSLSIPELYRKCEQYKKSHGIKLVIIDDLQSLYENSLHYYGQEIKPKDIPKAIKNLARIFELPVITLSQLNRNPENRKDKRPTISDFHLSKSITNEADVCI